jgi:hypothetical protein
MAKLETAEIPCIGYVQGGLYDTFDIRKSGNFTEDLKTYLSSESFEMDLHSGKWGAGIEVIADGIPIGLSANSESDDLHKKQQKIVQSKTLYLNKSFYDYALSRVANVALAEKYNQCLRDNNLKQGWIVTANISDKEVTFTLEYRNSNHDDPMPVVQSLDVSGRKLIQGPKVKERLGDTTIIKCDRDPKVQLTLTLQTNREDAVYSVPASEDDNFISNLPLGTVIENYLNWDNFQKLTNNNSNNPAGNNLWTMKYSKWSPCDGRDISESKYTKNWGGLPNAPDKRGLFTRGLNQFDSKEKDYVSPVSEKQKDPDDNRGIATPFQTDEIKSHDHPVSDNPKIMVAMGIGWGNVAGGNNGQATYGGEGVGAIGHRGGVETRPKNIAVYYYMKIN